MEELEWQRGKGKKSVGKGTKGLDDGLEGEKSTI